MESHTLPRFIVIDDDDVSCYICRKVIQHTFPEATVLVFKKPEDGIEAVNTMLQAPTSLELCLFLDLNMPGMNGWELLEKISVNTTPGLDRIQIYLLTASADPGDMNRANEHPLVAAYVKKPINTEKLQIIFRNYYLNKRFTV